MYTRFFKNIFLQLKVYVCIIVCLCWKHWAWTVFASYICISKLQIFANICNFVLRSTTAILNILGNIANTEWSIKFGFFFFKTSVVKILPNLCMQKTRISKPVKIPQHKSNSMSANQHLISRTKPTHNTIKIIKRFAVSSAKAIYMGFCTISSLHAPRRFVCALLAPEPHHQNRARMFLVRVFITFQPVIWLLVNLRAAFWHPVASHPERAWIFVCAFSTRMQY